MRKRLRLVTVSCYIRAVFLKLFLTKSLREMCISVTYRLRLVFSVNKAGYWPSSSCHVYRPRPDALLCHPSLGSGKDLSYMGYLTIGMWFAVVCKTTTSTRHQSGRNVVDSQGAVVVKWELMYFLNINLVVEFE